MSRAWLKAKLTVKYFRNKLRGMPVHAAVEVTKRCNARCRFCDYWKTGHESALSDYSEIVRRIGPVYVSITGGEPLLRRDLEGVISSIKRKNTVYVGMVTNGWLLTEERAASLLDAGVDQLAVSLDFPDERHDEFRGLRGLFGRIKSVVPRLSGMGFDRVVLNTVIMRENLDDLLSLARLATEWGVYISYSAYDAGKNDSSGLWIESGMMDRLRSAVAGIIEHKRRFGNVRSSVYYLERVPEYFEGARITGCPAGRAWVQVTPEGMIKPCSELEPVCRWDEYDPSLFGRVGCTRCWYSCRGEAQAPLDWRRYKEFL